ncbi:porin family protein [Lutibacter sp.]|uniref:porin family protein n=1 Tax=Lutibacter sp. TaxID=1925666 RepID=UPI0025C33F83|nr:porin family protein [Lutibacter sp.]MCF6182714.1 PorT family protein [Lutibacter sp.]
MKKIILTIICLININILIYSQEKIIKIGVKLGLNYTLPKLNNNSLAVLENKIGFSGGMFMNYNFSNKLAVQPELLFSTQNFNYTIENFDIVNGSTNKKGINKESYLNIPILLKYFLVNKFDIEFGPQIGFIINSNTNLIFYNKAFKFDKPNDKFNFSGNIGIGYDISTKMNLGIRYNFGILELNGFKNSVLQFNIDCKI